MMIICCRCQKLLNDGDRVSVTVTSTFHVIKSEKAFCLDKHDLYADSSTMYHEDCGE